MHQHQRSIIKIDKLSQSYVIKGAVKEILKDISLDIKHGEFVAIVGESGSGKSTLLNIIGLMEKHKSGRFFIDGADIGTIEENFFPEMRNKFIGFIFQQYHLIPFLSVMENILLPSVYGNKKKSTDKASSILSALGIRHLAKHLPSQLSGGQQQRVSIGRALMNDPKIILADEPTGALDDKTAQGVMQILHDLHSRGHTIIVVTHDRDIALQAQRVIEIVDGKIDSDSSIASDYITYNSKKNENIQVFSFLRTIAIATRFSIKAIFSHKLRSFLSVIGIVIGMSAVVTSIAIGEGSKKKILNQISLLAENSLEVRPGGTLHSVSTAERRVLSISDVDAISNEPAVDMISPVISRSASVFRGRFMIDTTLSGVGVEYFKIKDISILKGSEFKNIDIVEKTQNVILNTESVQALFSDAEEVIGSVVKINGNAFRVIGIANEKKSNASHPEIWIPFSSLVSRITGDSALTKIVIKSKFRSSLTQAVVGNILISKHGRRDFHFFSNHDLSKAINNTSNIMGSLISTIAAISLIVGGVGIMNVMLVSVVERTPEIGIRLAIGAKPKDILLQFLIESAFLCSIGGFFGVLLSFLLCMFAPLLFDDLTLVFDTRSALLSFISSAFTGILFGFIPAKKASSLQPRDALSRE
ncbi:macrolide ABC transporter permease/ATP-binding protein MacB [Aeromonas jandaei]|uniref:ATP-binding cassette domain-containing protein n=1 Tax=Aeromonas jandaei TaxID=650 RepID=UPI000CE247C3|nr:ATP-binding cassette domain-containing protein [Aeromonas jandaei]PPA27877.1 macrolide ABC transporter permease/ATP-binding protein MacB [Aeromonas jandaei]